MTAPFAIVDLIGLGMFESTAIQFGMDQMLEAPSEQFSTFIHWYYWSSVWGQPIIVYIYKGIIFYISLSVNLLDMPHVITKCFFATSILRCL